VISGSGSALAIHCGSDSVIGEMTQRISIPSTSGFETGLRSFGTLLLKITLFLSLIVLLLNFLRQFSLLDSVLFSLALAVGMAPELLPAITGMAMSVGAGRLMEKEVLVKDIHSIQNLGEISLLCTDKTGTLTEGKISAAGFKNAEGEEDAFVKELAFLNAAFSTAYANPIEEALESLYPEPPDFSSKAGELPYDFVRKRVSISIRQGVGYRIISKGAFKEMLNCCSHIRHKNGAISEIQPFLPRLLEAQQQYGAEGLRSLLVGYREKERPGIRKEDEADLILAGFALFHDPVKAGVQEAIRELEGLKIGLKILSGDSLPVLVSLAKKIGLEASKCLTGNELDKTTSESLRLKLEETCLFAELEPRHKERIIQTLREKHVLAYLGDGINDVTALHAADVGISVNNASGIAIEAADFVLLRKDIRVLADGVREGRRTFANTLKYIYISTGATFGNMLSVAVSSLFLPFIPMLPKQILFTNFISDFPFLAVSSDEVDQEQLRAPGSWNMPIIRDFMITFGLHSSVFDLATFYILLNWLKMDKAEFQTAWFMESVVTEILILFVIRTRRPFFRSRPAGNLLWLGLSALLFTLLLPWLPPARWLGLVPVHPEMMAWLLLIFLVYLFSAEALKLWFFRHREIS
jgi:Mg2+-importing ATPase